jgi:hypothetical protein
VKEFLPRFQAPILVKDERGQQRADLNIGYPLRVRKTGKAKTKGTGPKQGVLDLENPSQSRKESGDEPARKRNPRSDLPTVTWVSIATGDRDADDLAGRAARYTPNAHALVINRDFEVYEGAIKHWMGKAEDLPGAKQAITKAVKEVYEIELVLRVMHARALEGRPEWLTEFGALVSEEALTMAVLGLVGAEAQLARRVPAVIGAIREAL